MFRLKRSLFLAGILVFTFLVITVCYSQSYNKEYEEYCYQVYKEIVDRNFVYAKFDGSQIKFYDKNHIAFDAIQYKEYNSKFSVIYIENDNETIKFWKSGFLDDGIGIVFFKDEPVNRALSGIKKIKRGYSHGNAFWFTT